MAKYKLLVRAKDGVLTQWIEKPDGSRYSTNERDITFIVESDYKDRVNPDDLLKQNGLKWHAGCSRPSTITAVNGWTIQVL